MMGSSSQLKKHVFSPLVMGRFIKPASFVLYAFQDGLRYKTGINEASFDNRRVA
jgi:hypothetical protein